jgi:hypothetical protein
MAYTLGQAARAVGRSKTTLNRAIKSGKISAIRGEDGSYTIDPAELQRAYPLTGSANAEMVRSVTCNGPEPSPSPELVALHRLLAEREETIRDLRARLDAEGEARRRDAEERRMLMALLTDQSRRPWWRRWFR